MKPTREQVIQWAIEADCYREDCGFSECDFDALERFAAAAREDLEKQLAAAQAENAENAENARLREVLYQVMDDIKSESYLFEGGNGVSATTEELADQALSQPTNTSSLEDMIQKAGEVMRERCAAESESNACPAYEYVSTAIPAKGIAEAIRALPGVTMEDLKK